MRVNGHPRRPNDIEDGQFLRPVQAYDFRSPWDAKRVLHFRMVGHGTPDDLLDGVIRGLFGKSVPAVRNELLGTEHAILSSCSRLNDQCERLKCLGQWRGATMMPNDAHKRRETVARSAAVERPSSCAR
jgi:hypothetical protein